MRLFIFLAGFALGAFLVSTMPREPSRNHVMSERCAECHQSDRMALHP